MRVALVGLGGAARQGHLPALRHLAARGRVELAAICDRDPARLAELAPRAPTAAHFPTVSAMLTAVRPELLVVATDPSAHLDLIALGFRYGCDVLCEKPVALRAADCTRLNALRAEFPQRALVAVHQYRYAPGWRRILGFAHGISRQTFEFGVRIDRPGTDPHASAPWRLDPCNGGGLADHGVHFLALAHDLAGSITMDSATRSYDDRGREQVYARLRVGNGTFELSVNYRADQRRTTVTLHSNGRWMNWTDQELEWGTADSPIGRLAVPALSDRQHVDGLYLPLYEDLLAHITEPRGRDNWWREVMRVGRILVGLGQLTDEPTSRSPQPAD